MTTPHTTTVRDIDGSPTNYTMTMRQFVAGLSPEEQTKNELTHNWDYEDAFRCYNCDCRPGGVWSVWPCGKRPPAHVAPWA